MAPLRLILAISCICVACSARLSPGLHDADPGAGSVRLLLGERGMARAVGHALVGAALPPGRPDGHAGESTCRSIRPVRTPSGHPTPSEILDAWQGALRLSGDSHGWLLEPVAGTREVALGAIDRASGLSSRNEEELVVCFHRPTPDWRERLRHPDLWVESGGVGAGVFRRTAEDGALLRDDTVPFGRGRPVRRVEIVTGDETEGFDLAVVHGRAAGRLLERDDDRPRMERIPAWDVSYALWLDPEARWTNDPSFRRWIDVTLGRDTTARYLFGDQASGIRSLLGGSGVEHGADRRPFSRTSSPRLVLAYEEADRRAASLAARIKAVLELSGVAVRLVTGPVEERCSMTLLAHRPPVADPLLGLLDTLWPLGESVEGELVRLERATRIGQVEARRERAQEIERSLLDDARLVPLVRVHAWLARHDRLSGVKVGPYGVIDLDGAEWRR